MRSPAHWPDLLHIEKAFLLLENKILDGTILDYRQIHPEAFAWHGWDLIPQARLFSMILPFLRQQVQRASRAMPDLYAGSLQGIHPESLGSPEDWHRIPLLVKDGEPSHGLYGFRQTANQNPLILRPSDSAAQSAVAFSSGGSLGRASPTFLTLADRQREIQAWRRGHAYHGLTPGDSVLYTYNTSLKGGQWMQESLWSHGANVYLRRPEEDPLDVLENIRLFRINALFTVQQPYEALSRQEKAAGISLHTLVQASLENPKYQGVLLPDARGQQQVEFIFLGGFPIVPYALELIQTYMPDTPIATLLGSSEAIPQACSTNPRLTPSGRCHNNNLHLLAGPHFIEVVKAEGDAWVPVKKGERGLLVYTSWARDGTIWIRYAPGDAATWLLDEGECPCGINSPVITDVQRLDPSGSSELLLHGCAAG
jgi:hypothetical protein